MARAAAAAAATPPPPDAEPLAEELGELVGLLWHGRTDALIGRLAELSAAAGPPRPADPKGHPRQALAANLAYFRRHRGHVDYPAYRAKGWPVGSGITESGVKRFGQRVKGTEQFWSVGGAEAILALRGKWLSEDEASSHYWLGRPPTARAA